jgi:hypothetical protein
MITSSLNSYVYGRHLASEAAGGSHTAGIDSVCDLRVGREQVGKCSVTYDTTSCTRRGFVPRSGSLGMSATGDNSLILFTSFTLSRLSVLYAGPEFT